jgi:hypothetical protein
VSRARSPSRSRRLELDPSIALLPQRGLIGLLFGTIELCNTHCDDPAREQR